MNQETENIWAFIQEIIDQLDKNNLEQEDLGDFRSRLEKILNSNYKIKTPFNFYPSSKKGPCREMAMFLSLHGSRWDLKKEERLSLEEMFKLLIRHCQGSCANKTKYVVIITDNWDDDVVAFWDDNIQMIKSNQNVTVEVKLIMGNRQERFIL